MILTGKKVRKTVLVCECDGETDAEVLSGAAYRGCFENLSMKTASVYTATRVF